MPHLSASHHFQKYLRGESCAFGPGVVFGVAETGALNCRDVKVGKQAGPKLQGCEACFGEAGFGWIDAPLTESLPGKVQNC